MDNLYGQVAGELHIKIFDQENLSKFNVFILNYLPVNKNWKCPVNYPKIKFFIKGNGIRIVFLRVYRDF